uniref:Uncharacterized protein n=1 Tax=Tanacetum cinerariifolium TaxID=118510 RepID=A0A699H999_TANCI|nr:hypothetical protein [Tanacetum cinerariifolium]
MHCFTFGHLFGIDIPVQEAPPSLDYVHGPKHPPSPDYVLGPKLPPLPVYVPYVPEREYLEYLVPSDVEAPIEDQPQLDDASPTALSSGYVVDSYLEEDPKKDHADYPADGGDGDDESSDDENDDDADDDEDENASEDDGKEEEDEHLATIDSSDVPVVDLVPSARDTEAFETDELLTLPTLPASLLTLLPSPLPRIPSLPLHVSSPPLPQPSPPTTSPTYVKVPLGYRANEIQMRAASPALLLPSTSYRTDILEDEMPPQKRACFTTLAF